jgi:hypothetical protein
VVEDAAAGVAAGRAAGCRVFAVATTHPAGASIARTRSSAISLRSTADWRPSCNAFDNDRPRQPELMNVTSTTGNRTVPVATTAGTSHPQPHAGLPRTRLSATFCWGSSLADQMKWRPRARISSTSLLLASA